MRYIWKDDHFPRICKTWMLLCGRACVYVDSFVIDVKELTVLRMFSPHNRICNSVISILGAEPASVGWCMRPFV